MDSDSLLSNLHGMKDKDDLILVGIEDGFCAGIRVWKLNESSIEEVAYRREFFFDKLADSRVHMNRLWTLEENGILKSTHIRTLVD